jgi:hypothetical protein
MPGGSGWPRCVVRRQSRFPTKSRLAPCQLQSKEVLIRILAAAMEKELGRKKGQYVFTQVLDHLPWQVFRRCVARYGGDHKIKHFSCLDQFRCFAFAQLTWRESLRDINQRTGLRCLSPRLDLHTSELRTRQSYSTPSPQSREFSCSPTNIAPLPLLRRFRVPAA